MNLDGVSTVSSLADYLKLESRNQPRQARAAFEEHSPKLLTCPWSRQARNHSFPARPGNLRDAKHERVFLGNSEGNYLHSAFYLLGTELPSQCLLPPWDRL